MEQEDKRKEIVLILLFISELIEKLAQKIIQDDEEGDKVCTN